MRKTAYLVTMASIVFSASGCSVSTAATSQKNATIFVAANATEPMNALIKRFEKLHPNVIVTPEYAGTQVLETQMEQGAQADFVLSADLAHIQKMKKEGLVSQYYPVSATQPVIVVPKNNPADIHSLHDLGSKPAKLVVGAKTVPVGQYAEQVFVKASKQYGTDFSQKALANVVSYETDVKQVLQKVAMGEVDAGIVYMTDVTPDVVDKISIVEIPKEFNVTATNYVSVPTNTPNKNEGNEFMNLVLSPEGQDVFKAFGYETFPGK